MGLPEEEEMGALVEMEASHRAWVASPPRPLLAWESAGEIQEGLVLQAEKPKVRLTMAMEGRVCSGILPFT